MQDLPETVEHHAATVGMRINALKTNVMPARIPGEQRQTVLLDGEPLGEVDKEFEYLGSMFIANGQGTEENGGKISPSAFSRLQSCLWSRRTKGRIYQPVIVR